MSIESKISAIVAKQVGEIQGTLETQIQERIDSVNRGFESECPNVDGLIRIVQTRNNLAETVNTYRDKVRRFEKFITGLRTLVTALKAGTEVQRNIPIPTSTPPGVGVPIGLTNRYAENLINSGRFLENVEKDIEGVEQILSSAERSLSTTIQRLDVLDEVTRGCIETLSEEDRRKVGEFINVRREDVVGGSEQQLEFRADNGKDYTLSVVEVEQESVEGAPVRRAVAKNNRGVIVLRGETSYSSDTSILIEDLKFRINTQLN